MIMEADANHTAVSAGSKHLVSYCYQSWHAQLIMVLSPSPFPTALTASTSEPHNTAAVEPHPGPLTTISSSSASSSGGADHAATYSTLRNVLGVHRLQAADMVSREPALASQSEQQLNKQLRELGKLLKAPEDHVALLCVKLPRLLVVPPGDMRAHIKAAAKLLKVC